MEKLKQKILDEGQVLEGDILKVDRFLNHQVDVKFLESIGAEFARKFGDIEVDKILTIETSGIAIAVITAKYFNYCPVVYAKKNASLNLDADIYESEAFSFTKNQNYRIMVSKRYLNPGERVLIIDDFLANGQAITALTDIIDQAGASLQGIGIVIEKGFMEGGVEIRKRGIDLESLAIVEAMDEDGTIVFKQK